MPVELAPLLWPLLASLAVVCGAQLHLARRRAALNRAIHELRRPLQALALAPEGGLRPGSRLRPGSLDLALIALDDLQGAVNGSRPSVHLRPVPARALAAAAVDRWRVVAARGRRPIRLEWRAGRAFVAADPARIAQALDNLLANAVEHGSGEVAVRATVRASGLRIAVSDGGPKPVALRRRGPQGGHGLAVARRIARAHDGRLELSSRDGETTASLELPIVPGPLAAVPIDTAAGTLGRRRRKRPDREPASPTSA